MPFKVLEERQRTVQKTGKRHRTVPRPVMEERNEYLVMVALVVGNVLLLYLLNKYWFKTLIFTVPGKACCGFCGIVILVTALLMLKYTKPVEYQR